jgi:hypothetical protein
MIVELWNSAPYTAFYILLINIKIIVDNAKRGLNPGFNFSFLSKRVNIISLEQCVSFILCIERALIPC